MTAPKSERSETAWTAGPWAYGDSLGSLYGLGGVRVLINYGTYEGMRWNDYDGVTPAQCEANKRLIAAAPEMAEKVQKLLDLIDRAAPRGWREHADPDGDYEAARALLARIRGEA